jgi:hypothetical protein
MDRGPRTASRELLAVRGQVFPGALAVRRLLPAVAEVGEPSTDGWNRGSVHAGALQ